MAVTQSVAFAAVAGFATNWGPSGTPESFGAISVPAGSIIAVICGADDATQVTAITITDAGSHTWTRATPTYGASMAATVDYWYNSTGSTVSINPSAALTYANNKSVGLMVLLIAGSSGVPHLVATLTNASTASTSGTPTVIGSLFILHVITQTPTAAIGTLATGSAIDSTATDNNGFSGANAFQIAAVHQTATNSQTSTPVTVGGSTPTTAGAYGVLEYVPPGGTTWQGVATMAATSGLSAGPIAKYAAAAVMAATSALTAGMGAVLTATAVMPAQSSVNAAARLNAAAAATLPATSGLTATPAPIAAAATLPANSGLAAAATITGAIAATLPATSGFTAGAAPIAGVVQLPATSSLAAAATLAAAAAATLPAISSLAANVTLLAAAAAVLPATSGLGADVTPPGASATLPAVSSFSATAAPAALAVTLTAISGLSATAGGTVATAVLAAASDMTAVAQVAAQAVTVLPGTSSFAAAAFIAYAAAAVLAAGSGFTATASAAGKTTPYIPGLPVPPRDNGITHPRAQGVTSPR